jgi:hypothetical protein
VAIVLIVVISAALTCILMTAVPGLRDGLAGGPGQPSRARVAAARPDPAPPQRAPAPPDSLEGALVAQLAAGAITRAQYLRAMEFIALREDCRDPLDMPSDE